MWKQGWREEVWSQLISEPWDLIIIGGGITGAGILREATRIGLRTLLLEGNDFASGTSSRSSKLVHGGLRYLRNRQIRITFESVRERERLLDQGRGLISKLSFLFPVYSDSKVPGWVFGLGLAFYDLLGFKWAHRHYRIHEVIERWPGIRQEGLTGGYRYFDAQTDDARLVLRVLLESVQEGGVALNYANVERLMRHSSGDVCGVIVRDCDPSSEGRTTEVTAPVVINATGAWADDLRMNVRARRRLRRLRGSHLVLPIDKVPISRAITFYHPQNRRPVFIFPWEGTVIVGTTDVDHELDMQAEPSINHSEVEYLLETVHFAFPSLNISTNDLISTYAGVRAVIDTGKADPSRESREHVIWLENGLLTITGGKLTTFRVMAHDALRAIQHRLPSHARLDRKKRVLAKPSSKTAFDVELDISTRRRILGRYGEAAPALIAASRREELRPIENTPFLWAEIRWGAQAEGVIHLDDLLMRRMRLGIISPEGGTGLLDQIREIAQPELGWNDTRWEEEAEAYRKLWLSAYAP
ncbi:MAG: FAD-dependent oxidoreductase [Anaerolineales bacterium]|nr:FAD-dependent oxidoreductase [Anaerolineales bacterium]